MKLTILVVGRLKEDYLKAAEAEYLKRLRPYCRLEVVEKKDEAGVLAALSTNANVYALDERGDLLNSDEFANELLGHEALHGRGASVVFVIGGADGHSDALRERAKSLISFGRLTIAHRLVRVILLEQIYRAFKILKNEPYHRA